MDEAVLAVEWPDRWGRAPLDAIRIEITPTADTERRVTIEGA